MVDTSMERLHIRSQRRRQDAVLYYSVYAIVFASAFTAFLIMKIAGRRSEDGVFAAARREAYTCAGYSVQF